ncbi:MAG TPA: hypothetical protein V6D29_14245 [Leptolyngbyaceae cyanobacterium]
MRVSIERGYQHHVQAVMEKLKTDDPKLAIHHIIGCWVTNQGCGGLHTNPQTSTPTAQTAINEDNFSAIADWS